jgi:hypothetical protein
MLSEKIGSSRMSHQGNHLLYLYRKFIETLLFLFSHESWNIDLHNSKET